MDSELRAIELVERVSVRIWRTGLLENKGGHVGGDPVENFKRGSTGVKSSSTVQKAHSLADETGCDFMIKRKRLVLSMSYMN